MQLIYAFPLNVDLNKYFKNYKNVIKELRIFIAQDNVKNVPDWNLYGCVNGNNLYCLGFILNDKLNKFYFLHGIEKEIQKSLPPVSIFAEYTALLERIYKFIVKMSEKDVDFKVLKEKILYPELMILNLD